MRQGAPQSDEHNRLRVQRMPEKPVLIFDGECRFCSYWIRRWHRLTGEAVQYVPLQDPSIAARFPEVPRERLEQAVHLIHTNGIVTRGAEAVFESLAVNSSWRWALTLYHTFPRLAAASEAAYRVVATHRTAFSLFTRLLWGVHTEPPSYRLVQDLFLRGLGVVYLAAFLSIWVQLGGLLGTEGVLPASQFLAAAQQYFDLHGAAIDRFHLVPTIFWLDSSDGALHLICGMGVLFSLLLVVGAAPALCTGVLWLFYLSIVTVGRDFLSFQWDALLLEAGFLALLFAPVRSGWRARASATIPWLPLMLLRWLLFRLMFESGAVKLLSGDPTWRHLTALDFHYETQPLPTWLAWYAHYWTAPVHRACVGVLFGIELALPFLIFAPRRLRFVAGVGFLILQLWILLTGNYGFFNYLTILLCLVLLDDAAIRRCLSGVRLARSRILVAATVNPTPSIPSCLAIPRRIQLRKWLTLGIALIILTVSAGQLRAMFGWGARGTSLSSRLAEWLAPFRIVNSYGLFAVMTTSRPEIVIEGSNDGQNWVPYEFKYKPGDPIRRPQFIAPHQPRLDWQMWFAALGSYPQNPWFGQFCFRLLQGSPPVLGLLETNPFPRAPPRFIRAALYTYRFAPSADPDRRAWWTRDFAGLYLTPISMPQARGPTVKRR